MELYLKSTIEFTSIAIKHNIPIPIIHYILSKNNIMTKCKLCFKHFETIWYNATCQGCGIHKMQCCKICWNNDLLTDHGKYCVNKKCNRWYCGKCCCKLVEFRDDIEDSDFGDLKCKCGHIFLCYGRFDLFDNFICISEGVDAYPITRQIHVEK